MSSSHYNCIAFGIDGLRQSFAFVYELSGWCLSVLERKAFNSPLLLEAAPWCAQQSVFAWHAHLPFLATAGHRGPNSTKADQPYAND